MWTRRDVIKLGLGAWLLHRVSPRPSLAAGRPSRPPPRYFLQLVLHGGLDAVLSTDPKTRDELAPGVDLPYGRKDIVEAGALRLGPHLRPLAQATSRLVIVNGVLVGTANHTTGSRQIMRMKTGVDRRMPSLLHLLSSTRQGQALGWISMGAARQEFASSGWFGAAGGKLGSEAAIGSLWDELASTEPADLERMAHALRSNARALAGRNRSTAESMTETAALMERLQHIPPFREERWSDDPVAQGHAAHLQRVLWSFQHDLVYGIHLNAGGLLWDTHEYNLRRQTAATLPLAAMLARFFSELEGRRNQHGTLGDHTLVVIGSELGRFPRLNGAEGKDHFPQAPYLLWSGRFAELAPKGAAFGRTGRQMEAARISLKSGKEGTHELSLDDLGTTILHWAGLEPTAHGYYGRVLEFLG